MNKTSGLLRNVSQKDALQEQLSRTYFPHKKPSRKESSKKQTRQLYNYPLLIQTFVIMLIAGGIIAAYLGLSHNLKMRRQVNAAELQSLVRNADIVEIANGWKYNTYIVSSMVYSGNKAAARKTSKEYLVLKNTEQFPAAEMTVDFRCPVDLSGKSILLSLKGERGGEKVCLVVKDSRNRSYKLSDIYLTSKWLTKTIPVIDAGRAIDATQIDRLRIERDYGNESSQGKRSLKDSNVFIKDISLVRNNSQK